MRKEVILIGVTLVALLASGSIGVPSSTSEPAYPMPVEGRRTRQWVLESYLPWKVDRFVWFSETFGREWYIRSGWVGAVRAAILATMKGGSVRECPRSLSDLLSLRFLAFGPLDRFPLTAIKERFLLEGTVPEDKRAAIGSAKPADEDFLLRTFAEGTVLFRQGRANDVMVVIIYQGRSDRTGPFKPSLSSVSCWRGDRKPPASDENGALWASLADSLFEFVASYTAFTGRVPDTITELDGTVGELNKKAWDDPEVGPILKAIAVRMLAVMKERVPSRPAIGGFEPAGT
jgi:hypothetical protein